MHMPSINQSIEMLMNVHKFRVRSVEYTRREMLEKKNGYLFYRYVCRLDSCDLFQI